MHGQLATGASAVRRHSTTDSTAERSVPTKARVGVAAVIEATRHVINRAVRFRAMRMRYAVGLRDACWRPRHTIGRVLREPEELAPAIGRQRIDGSLQQRRRDALVLPIALPIVARHVHGHHQQRRLRQKPLTDEKFASRDHTESLAIDWHHRKWCATKCHGHTLGERFNVACECDFTGAQLVQVAAEGYHVTGKKTPGGAVQ